MPVFFVAVVVIAVISAIYGAIAARKRRESLLELAQRLNLNFAPEPDYGLAERFGFLKKLAQGDNRYAYNVLSGTYQNNDTLAFDYHYQVPPMIKTAAIRRIGEASASRFAPIVHPKMNTGKEP
jgi:hypothetical protein